MKFCYIILTMLPLAIAALPPVEGKPPTFCKCAPIKCPETQPAVRYPISFSSDTGSIHAVILSTTFSCSA